MNTYIHLPEANSEETLHYLFRNAPCTTVIRGVEVVSQVGDTYAELRARFFWAAKKDQDRRAMKMVAEIDNYDLSDPVVALGFMWDYDMAAKWVDESEPGVPSATKDPKLWVKLAAAFVNAGWQKWIPGRSYNRDTPRGFLHSQIECGIRSMIENGDFDIMRVQPAEYLKLVESTKSTIAELQAASDEAQLLAEQLVEEMAGLDLTDLVVVFDWHKRYQATASRIEVSDSRLSLLALERLEAAGWKPVVSSFQNAEIKNSNGYADWIVSRILDILYCGGHATSMIERDLDPHYTAWRAMREQEAS